MSAPESVLVGLATLLVLALGIGAPIGTVWLYAWIKRTGGPADVHAFFRWPRRILVAMFVWYAVFVALVAFGACEGPIA